MHFSSIDDFLWAFGIVGELLLLAILIFRGSYKLFPVFTVYIVWLTISDPLLLLVLGQHHDQYGPLYYRVFFAFTVIQYALELGVLLEIASAVLRPVRQMFSLKFSLVFLALMAAVALGAFLITAHVNAATLSHPRTYFMISTTMAILRLVTFLMIAGCSQLLGLSWKNHVLQLTAGLAFYGVVTLIVELAHSRQRAGPHYAQEFYALDHLRIGGYLCALYFWCYAFAKKEAPRKEFSPQMAKFLVSISGSTKRQRAVIARTRDQ